MTAPRIAEVKLDDHYSIVAEIVQLPDGIRGYEQIKLDNIRTVKDRAQRLMGLLREPEVPAV